MTITAEAPSAQVVAEFPKNASEIVRAQLTEYQGRPIASLWVYLPTASGEFIASRKGLSLSADRLPELEAAVRALRAAAGSA